MTKNKKAGIFAAGMVLATIIFIVTAWFAFSTTNKNIAAEIELLPILTSVYNEQDRFSLYMDETKKLAASQAFYALTKEGSVEKTSSCKVEYTTRTIIWNSECKPEKDYIKKAFLEEFNKSFDSLVKSYPNENLRQNYIHILNEQEDIVTSIAQPSTIKIEKKGIYANYAISFSTEKTATITTNLTEQGINIYDFIEIYDKVMEKKSKCDRNEDCFKNLDFKDWNVKIEKQNNYYFFELTTKKAFFFIENNNIKFEPIKLKFVLE